MRALQAWLDEVGPVDVRLALLWVGALRIGIDELYAECGVT